MMEFGIIKVYDNGRREPLNIVEPLEKHLNMEVNEERPWHEKHKNHPKVKLLIRRIK